MSRFRRKKPGSEPTKPQKTFKQFPVSPTLHEEVLARGGMDPNIFRYRKEDIQRRKRLATDLTLSSHPPEREFYRFYPNALAAMRRFIVHCTSLSPDGWDKAIAEAKNDLEMFHAIALFCHPEPQIRDEPETLPFGDTRISLEDLSADFPRTLEIVRGMSEETRHMYYDLRQRLRAP